MTRFTVNGRSYYPRFLRDFRKVSPSTYSVVRNETTYEIFGGKKAGGRRNEWYVECAEWSKPIYCTSLIDALNMLDGM